MPNVAKITKLQKLPDGYKWAGYPSGLDNTPRGKITERATKDRPDNPNMLWIDAICQQALSALCISKMFRLIGDELKAGDFKYQDMNGDGYVDSSDACVIGDATPKLLGALNLNLGWKNFDLAVLGTFRAFYEVQLTNSWFWNGWGDNNYSNYTLRHINDPAAPRLTYNKVNNNFQASSRWLADGSFFKVQSVELGYNIPVSHRLGKVVRGVRVYARANNLLTLSGIEDVDPEALGSGISNYPLMKTFTGGLKMTF